MKHTGLKGDNSLWYTTLHYNVNTHYSSCTWTTTKTNHSQQLYSPYIQALPSAILLIDIGSTLCHCIYPLLLGLLSVTGSTLCYRACSLLLALPSATVSTLCYWVYSLLLGLLSATGSTLCYHWLYTIYPRPCGTSNL